MASFHTKSNLAILGSLIGRMRATTAVITDYTVGSVARTLLESAAQEVDELYQQCVNGLTEGIAVSIYTAFSFPALGPIAAAGLIRVTITSQNASVLIPSETTFTPLSGVPVYVSTADVTIAFGATFADIPVVSTVVDVVGNIASGTEFTLGTNFPGLVSASNLSAFIGGAPAELESARKVRFGAYVQTLSRGTIASLIYALTRLVTVSDPLGNVLERVATAAIFEPYLTDPTVSPGLVVAYIHNGVGHTSEPLVIQAAAVLNGFIDQSGNQVAGYKAIGVKLQVIAAAEAVVDVVGMLTIAPTFDQAAVCAQATSAIYTYITQIPVGQPYLPAVANELVMEIPGVWNWMPISPVNYVSVVSNTKLMPGRFQIIGWLSARTTVRTSVQAFLI